ncbi:MAG: hypothetical protein PHY83_03375 [Bacilli bacterium]|nr:hypothetical protein [Bacilli bacterium]
MKDNLVEIQIKGTLHICVDLKYSLGGYSGFSMEKNKRGYYLHVKPLEIEGKITSFKAFSGYKILIQETTRKSFNGYIKALTTLINDHKDLIKKMITAVGLQEGLVEENIEVVYNETMEQLETHLKKETEVL